MFASCCCDLSLNSTLSPVLKYFIIRSAVLQLILHRPLASLQITRHSYIGTSLGEKSTWEAASSTSITFIVDVAIAARSRRLSHVLRSAASIGRPLRNWTLQVVRALLWLVLSLSVPKHATAFLIVLRRRWCLAFPNYLLFQKAQRFTEF